MCKGDKYAGDGLEREQYWEDEEARLEYESEEADREYDDRVTEDSEGG